MLLKQAFIFGFADEGSSGEKGPGIAPVLQVVAAPLWQVMAPWFPAPVNPQL